MVASYSNIVLIALVLIHETSITAGNSTASEGTWLASENPDIIVNTFDQIASETIANVQMIKTCTGRYSYSAKRLRKELARQSPAIELDGRPFWKEVKGFSEFAVDRSTNSTLMLFEPDQTTYTLADTEEVVPYGARVPAQVAVVTPDRYLTLMPRVTKGQLKTHPTTTATSGPVGYSRAPPHRSRVERLGTSLINPITYLGEGGRQTWEMANSFSTAISSEQQTLEQLSRIQLNSTVSNGNQIYSFRIGYNKKSNSESGRMYVTYRFEEAFGFNLTDWNVYVDDILLQSRSMSFSELSGIFYPSRIEERRYEPKTGEVRAHSIYESEKIAFNEEISPKTFSWQGIAPVNGTRIVDEVDHVLYVYDEGKLIDPEDYVPPMPIELVKEDRGFGPIVLWANIIIIFFIAFLVIAKRRQSSN